MGIQEVDIGQRYMSELDMFLNEFKCDEELGRNVAAATTRVQSAVVDDGVRDLALAFSGGKDSTALLVLAAHAVVALRLQRRVHLRVVFADTRLELPPITKSAYAVLSHFRSFCDEHDVDFTIHLTERELSQSFWVLMLGKGYPPPNRYFRWCTDRLKIQPPRAVLRTLKTKAGLATGVRSDESEQRSRKVTRGCSADGECGVERWADAENTEGLNFYAPLVDWRTCKIWDFLNFWASPNGWPVDDLIQTYGTGATRFGCWTCTLVDEDKALARVSEQSEWSHLADLAKFRKTLLEEAQRPENRLVRQTGAKGKLTLSFRKKLLDELLGLQEAVSHHLISQEEVDKIHELWQEEIPSVYAPTRHVAVEQGSGADD